MALTDVRRHINSVKEHSLGKFPAVSPDDMFYVVEYLQPSHSPSVTIQVVPIEGTKWSQYLNETIINTHRKRRQMKLPSDLIMIQCFRGKKPTFFLTGTLLEEETYIRPFQKIEHFRSVVCHADGTRLESLPDIYDEILRLLELLRSKENRWICHLTINGRDEEQLDIFEIIEVLYKIIADIR